MTDSVVEVVRQDLLDRSQIGIKKYGVTLDRNDLSLKDWLIHAYEECLDQANYLKRSILELERKEEELKQKAEKDAKEAQAWEDFRDNAFDNWKKRQEESMNY